MFAAALLGVAALEGGAAIATRLLVSQGRMAEIPAFTATQVEEYFAHREALGWTSSFVTPDTPCVSAYGDAFTAGSDGAAYPAELARLLDCPVANYGVAGYGSDQALMLASSLQAIDAAPVAILGHVSDNILANLNQYRNLVSPGHERLFKPRFILDDDNLRTIASPIQTREDFLRLSRSPEAVLTYDEFNWRPRRDFPHALSLVRWLLRDFRVRAAINGVPAHEPFYHPDHPDGGLRLTQKILMAFTGEIRRDSRHEVIVLIPTGTDMVYAKKTGRWPDQALADGLKAINITVVHAGPVLLSLIGKDQDPCHLFVGCDGPFNALGHRTLALQILSTVKGVMPRRSHARGNR